MTQALTYSPAIDFMDWSFSRLKTYEDCPHRWKLLYLTGEKDESKFYASYGSFIHKILELYYSGILVKSELVQFFLENFSIDVEGVRPPTSTLEKYIAQGVEYFRNFEPLPYKCLAIEQKYRFKLGGYDFVGVIDFLGEDEDGIIIVDNKSKDLKPKSGKKNATNDRAVDETLLQLYIYSHAVAQNLDKMPKKLALNCFRNGNFIVEDFDPQKYEESEQWAVGVIEKIKRETEFPPNPNYFKCRWICGVSNSCETNLATIEEWKNSR